MVDTLDFEDTNERLIDRRKRTCSWRTGNAWYYKASLATNSFFVSSFLPGDDKSSDRGSNKGKVDPLIGLKENVIIGKLIPAGTGMRKYRDVKLDTELEMDDEITLEDFEELTEGVVEETAVDETSEEFTEE